MHCNNTQPPYAKASSLNRVPTPSSHGLYYLSHPTPYQSFATIGNVIFFFQSTGNRLTELRWEQTKTEWAPSHLGNLYLAARPHDLCTE